MDCVTAATSLKKLLIAHEAADRQISLLDDLVSDVSQQTLVSALNGQKSQDLHLSLRLSVSEGVRTMYHNFTIKKWSQVQETARSIIQNLEGDLDSEETTSPIRSSPRVTTSVDKAADKWSMAFCDFYRDN